MGYSAKRSRLSRESLGSKSGAVGALSRLVRRGKAVVAPDVFINAVRYCQVVGTVQ